MKSIILDEMQYWLMKTEPSDFSIDHLEKDKKTLWSGVRNFQARNFMKVMKVNDLVYIYHSSTKVPGIAGLGKVSKEVIPDPSQFDKASKYYDSSSSKENPKWYCVEVSFVKKFSRIITLEELRTIKELSSMKLLQRGSRLSVMPVSKSEYDKILTL